MERLAAATAFCREPFRSAEDQVARHYDQVRLSIAAKLESEIAYLAEQRLKSATDLAGVNEHSRKAQEESSRLDEHLDAARNESCACNADLKQAVYAVRQAQLAHPDEDRQRHQDLVTECTATALDRFRAECQLRSAHKEIALESLTKEWAKNAPEYRRRADELAAEKERIEAQLGIIEKHTGGLRKIGVTRNVSGFLFWVGSLTVAAAGTLISEFIAKHDRSASAFDQVITNLRTLIVGANTHVTFWTIINGLLPVVLILASIILLAVGLTWTVERLTRVPDRRRRRPPTKTGFFARLWPLGFLRRDVALSIDNITLRTLLHNLPGLVMVPIVACIIIALTPQTTKLQSACTSIAVAFILSFHALSVLCATLILGPRLRTILEHLDENTTTSAVAARASLTATAVLGITSVLALGLAPTATDTVGWPLTPLALFLLLGGFALPFSIIFRGLFKDYDFLQNRREWFRKQIADLRSQPTEEDLDLDEDNLKDTIKGWRSRTAALDHQHYLELCRRYYDDCGLAGPLTDLLRDPCTPSRIDATPWFLDTIVEHRLERPEPLVYYRLVPNDLLDRFNTAYARRSATRERIAALQEQRAAIQALLHDGQVRSNSLQLSVQTYDAKINAARQSYHDDLLALHLNHFTDHIFLQEAWSIAERGASDLSSPLRPAPVVASA
jgi:hypothetical protein